MSIIYPTTNTTQWEQIFNWTLISLHLHNTHNIPRDSFFHDLDLTRSLLSTFDSLTKPYKLLPNNNLSQSIFSLSQQLPTHNQPFSHWTQRETKNLAYTSRSEKRCGHCVGCTQPLSFGKRCCWAAWSGRVCEWRRDFRSVRGKGSRSRLTILLLFPVHRPQVIALL